MSLADYYGSGYFPEGKHRARITGTRFFNFNSGSLGVEFAISDGRRNGKISFCLKPTALWKLANFAADLGITHDQMKRIDPECKRGFETFLGKQFVAVVTKGESGYSEVNDWEPVSSDFDPYNRQAAPQVEPEPPQAQEHEVPAPTGDDNPPPYTDSDIPF